MTRDYNSVEVQAGALGRGGSDQDFFNSFLSTEFYQAQNLNADLQSTDYKINRSSPNSINV